MHSFPKSGTTRILYCEGNIDGTVGGSYFSLLYLTKNLNRDRFSPKVVFHKKHSLLKEYEEAGVETEIIPLPRPCTFAGQGTDNAIAARILNFPLRLIQRAVNAIRFSLIYPISLSVYIRRNRIDLLHLNNSIIRNHHWMLAAIFTRTMFITHERGINSSYSFLSKLLAKRIGAIICISNAVRDSLTAGNVRAKRMPVIYNGLDPSEMTNMSQPVDLRSKYSLRKDAPLIGVVGNVKKWKGQETVIRALPAILSRHPYACCFLIGDIAPGDKAYFAELEKLIHESTLDANVIFTGFTNDVAGYMGGLDIVLHTSIDPEPFGRVLLEAMALKKPSIGAAGGAVPEIVLHGETGLTFRPKDHADLAKAVTELLDDPGKAARMAEAGHKRLVECFHISKNVEYTERLYGEVLESDAVSRKREA